MVEGKDKKLWDGWASLLAMQANCNIDTRKTRPYSIYFFHPYPPKNKGPQKESNGVKEVVGINRAVIRRMRYGPPSKESLN